MLSSVDIYNKNGQKLETTTEILDDLLFGAPQSQKIITKTLKN